MVLKRKRSDSELCSSPSSSSISSFGGLSSPPTARTFMMDVSPRTAAFAAAPAHLHSRTLKRFRDSRPSDDAVHRKFYEWRAHHHRRSLSSQNSSCLPAERTLTLLYGGAAAVSQHQHHQSQDVSMHTAQSAFAAAQNTPSTNSQQSLHRFWNIHSAPSSTDVSSAVLNQTPVPTNCEDCGAGLMGGNDAGGMDLDGQGLEGSSCGACGKHVCFSCSVSNLGEQKRCLQCAGRKVWVGGIGWTDVAIPVY